MGWQELIVVILLGSIIGLAIAAWVSLRGYSDSGPISHNAEQPDQRAADPLARRPGQQRLRPMRERQAELHRALRQRSGHVDTVMIKLPPKDGDGKDGAGR